MTRSAGLTLDSLVPRAATWLALVAGMLALAATGCAGFGPALPTGEDVAVKMAERKAATVASLEHRRDVATLDAAADHLARGDRTTSRKMLEQLLTRDPKHSSARLLLARVYLDSNQHSEAEEQLRAGLASDESNAALHYELGLLLDSQDHPEANTHLRRASELEPRNDLYRLASGTSPPARETPMAKARASSSPAISKKPPTDPNDPATRVAALLQQGKPDEALELVQSALEAQPDSAPLHRLAGAAHLARREADLAVDALHQSLALDNSCGLSYFLLGHALSQVGDQQAAESAFGEAARRDARLARDTVPHSSSAPLAPDVRR